MKRAISKNKIWMDLENDRGYSSTLVGQERFLWEGDIWTKTWMKWWIKRGCDSCVNLTDWRSRERKPQVQITQGMCVFGVLNGPEGEEKDGKWGQRCTQALHHVGPSRGGEAFGL